MACSISILVDSSHSRCGGVKEEDKNAFSVTLLSCRKDVSGYLRSLGASGARGQHARVCVSEVDLILNRAGLFVLSDQEIEQMTICSRHRKLLTVNWPGGKAVTCRCKKRLLLGIDKRYFSDWRIAMDLSLFYVISL